MKNVNVIRSEDLCTVLRRKKYTKSAKRLSQNKVVILLLSMIFLTAWVGY